jgi:capsular polysaccharide biosynthesis protein
MSLQHEPDSFEFADYLGVLRRRWWVVLALVVVGIAGAGFYLAKAPRSYMATAAVNVTPASAQNTNGAVTGGRTTGTVNLDTEAQIVQSGTVAEIAAHELHSSLPLHELLASVFVTVPANSSVLQISCTARTGAQAASCANDFAAGYLQNRNQSAASAARGQLNTVQSQLSSLEKQAAQLATQASTLPTNSSQRAAAQTQLQAANSQIQVLAGQAAQLSAQAASPSGGSIITKAVTPTTPSSPKKPLILASGLVAGLIVGLIGAFLLDKRDKRITNLKGLRQFGVPVLADLSAQDLKGAPLARAATPAATEFGELAAVVSRVLGDGSHLILIAGSAPGRSGSALAANLAVALAERTGEVILVCPDKQAVQLFWPRAGLPEADAVAIGDFLAGHADIGKIAGPVRQPPGLRVLVTGQALGGSPGTLPSLASELRASARYVVVDAAAPGTGPASELAEFCDAAVLAAELPGTKSTDVHRCLWRLDRLGLQVLGIVALPRLRRGIRPSPQADGAAAEPVVDEAITSPDWEDHEPAGDGHPDHALSSRAKADAMDSVSEK